VAGLGAVSRFADAGRPAFLRWLPDSLFDYYLSTARRPPFSRSWNVASSTALISSMAPGSVAHGRTARTNPSPPPCSGTSRTWLLMSIRVVVSVPCQMSYATAHCWTIRTLPCLATMCQDDLRNSVLSTCYSENYQPLQHVVYEGCVGMNVALVSADLLSTLNG
jgi:hypothetical protein